MSGRFDSFFFRLITRDDLPTLHRWIQQPHVAEWWDSPSSLAAVEDDYLPSIEGATSTRAYIASLNEVPVGFIQEYVVIDSGGGWWESEDDPGARGIDQFLADPDRLNQGFGSAIIRNFVAGLFDDPVVTKVQADPSPANHRAIRCYIKAGFVPIGQMITPDGPAVLMRCERTTLALGANRDGPNGINSRNE